MIVEGFVALALVGGFVVWIECYGGAALAARVLDGNRSSIYGTVASILGSLLGFTITAVAIVLGSAQHDRMKIVRESSHYPQLWDVFMSAIRFLGLGTLAAVLGLLLDRDTDPNWLVFELGVLFAVVSVFRLARVVWIMEKIIVLVTSGPPSSAKSSG